MSHFTLMVVTQEEPTEDVLARALQPFHEYECTGDDDEYVVDVDVTDAIKAAYEEHGKGRPLAVFAAEWNGAAERDGDGRFYRHTNPNKKWDWWQRGGRWQGMLLPKAAATTYIGTKSFLAEDPNPMRPGGVDSVRAKDLDLERMEEEEADKAAWNYDRAAKLFERYPDFQEFSVRDGEDLSAAWKRHWAQDGGEEWLEEMGPFAEMSDYRVPRDQFIDEARVRCLQTFAVLMDDGKWYQRGEMGWWGVVTDEKNKDEWDREFAQLVRGLPPEAWITIVDCHI